MSPSFRVIRPQHFRLWSYAHRDLTRSRVKTAMVMEFLVRFRVTTRRACTWYRSSVTKSYLPGR
jgi:hypothetical protein